MVLNWEAAYGKAYQLLVSDDLTNWQEVYATNDGKGGVETIEFQPVKVRYVKMQGIKRATQWGYSLYEMEVYRSKKMKTWLSPVHFIRLQLTDSEENLLSDNFYWRGNKPNDYTALNSLQKPKIKTTSKLSAYDGKKVIEATIRNNNKAVAFAVHVQAYRKSDGERILPAIMSDNYFTLLKGEAKNIRIEFDENLLPDGAYYLKVEPYNK